MEAAWTIASLHGIKTSNPDDDDLNIPRPEKIKSCSEEEDGKEEEKNSEERR
jgi:hypothetical protein